MSKRKQHVDNAAPTQPKLHEFPNWSFSVLCWNVAVIGIVLLLIAILCENPNEYA
jgi:hypothetical protein